MPLFDKALLGFSIAHAWCEGGWPVRNLVEIDPLYCTAHVDLGQALLAVSDLQEATRHFGIASGLGPPVDMTGAFLVGYCHKLLGDDLTAPEFMKLAWR